VKKSRFTEAQIVAILKELAATAATELVRRHGLHAHTIRQWRDKYAGLDTSDLTRLTTRSRERAQRSRDCAADHGGQRCPSDYASPNSRSLACSRGRT
jgi:putative transposase